MLSNFVPITFIGSSLGDRKSESKRLRTRCHITYYKLQSLPDWGKLLVQSIIINPAYEQVSLDAVVYSGAVWPTNVLQLITASDSLLITKDCLT